MARHRPARSLLAHEGGQRSQRGLGVAFGALEVANNDLGAGASTAGEYPRPPALMATLLDVVADGCSLSTAQVAQRVAQWDGSRPEGRLN